MKTSIVLIFLIGFCINASAQIVKDSIPIEVKKNFFSTKYFYDGQRIYSPYGLQIPLLQLQDATVNKHFMVFKRSRSTAKAISLLSAGFSLYAFFNSDKVSGSTYWITVGSIGVVSGYFNVRSDVHLDKAIKQYNKVIAVNKFGFHYDRTYHGHGILSVGITGKF